MVVLTSTTHLQLQLISSNDAGLVQGHLDIPLHRRGRAQIQNVAKVCKSPFTRIYTSDLTRAVEV
jgi:broad specificity phosphatase PhoE